MRKSPFKFLDAFTKEDAGQFFGRDQEVDALYNMVFKTPMVLVYGMSGTGKTSLVQCGLAAKFERPDWLPILIRRGKNINDALQAALSRLLVKKPYTNPKQAIDDLFYTYFRPIYLFFDQFEELFILGTYQEQQQFILNIQQLMEKELPCKVVLIMREEYIGQLYNFEKYLPYIFDYKLRVEPMNNKQVQEVLQNSFEQFNIEVEAPADENCQLIIDNISVGKSGIPLTYLQVYMDMLYREDFARTYPNDHPIALPPLTFTKAEIDEFGRIDDVLDRYLKEKTLELQQRLQQDFKDCPPNFVSQVLDIFVTEEGTKRPINYQKINEEFKLEPTAAIVNGSTSMVSKCLEALENYRILRIGDNTIELAHDSLGLLIDQNRTDDQRLLNQVKIRLVNAYREYEETGQFLTEKQLVGMEEFFPQLHLEKKIDAFITESQQALQQQKKAEIAEQQGKLEEQRKTAEKERVLRENAEKAKGIAEKNARRARLLAGLGFLLFAFALTGMTLAYTQTQKAQKAETSANKAFTQLSESEKNFRNTNHQNYLQLGRASMNQGKFKEAIQNFEVALTFKQNSPTVDTLIRQCQYKATIKTNFDTYMTDGNLAFEEQQYIKAFQQFGKARKLNLGEASNRAAALRTEATTVKMFPIFKEYLQHALLFTNAERHKFARYKIKQAESFLPYLDKDKLTEEIALLNSLKTRIKN